MRLGYVKIGAFTPKVQVANVDFNADNVIDGIKQAKERGVDLVVFPELVLTSATCGDLFYNKTLLNGALEGLKKVCFATFDFNGVALVGLPFEKDGYIYNVCAVINQGKVIALIPKTAQSGLDVNKGRFSLFVKDNQTVKLFGEQVPFGANLLFREKENQEFCFGVEFGCNLNSANSISTSHVFNGARIIACLGASPMTVGKPEYYEQNIKAHSSKLVCGYAYAEAGEGETTSDMVFGGANVIAENGKILSFAKPFSTGLTVSDIDLDFIAYERNRLGVDTSAKDGYVYIDFVSTAKSFKLDRKYPQYPFLPNDLSKMGERADFILDIQAEALKKRIAHTYSKTVVLGLSGGLDSTLAIIVCAMAMKKLGRSAKDVVAVTMPCFGTTGRTFNNSVKLAKALGTTLKKIDIAKAVTRHLKDIEHDGALDVTYENAQARERTQVLMDVANMTNGIVIGTGDLSELALGWATYNGDHMSMYAVNGALPKTLIRHVVHSYALKSKTKLKTVLFDILDTPVSPELLPAKDGEIAQKTEDIVGPYTLHDFYLYNIIRYGFTPKKLYYVTKETFKGDFDEQTILKWLKTFIRRFFIQQFKRTCQPDGIKVGSVGLSARSDWNMPADAVSKLWLDELENL